MSNPKFIQLATTCDPSRIPVETVIVALDENGRVWKYCPEVNKGGKIRFAFWTKLTDHRADPAENPSGRATQP